MFLKTELIARQTQKFKLGHVVDILQMTAVELAQHVAASADENPLLTVSGNRVSIGVSASSTDVLEDTVSHAADSLYAHVSKELSDFLSQGGLLKRVIFALIEELEPSGWLGRPLNELASEMNVSDMTMEAVLTVVQKCVDPAGLFARDLTECLRLQLERGGQYEGQLAKVLDNIKLLETCGVQGLARSVGLSRNEVSDWLMKLAKLDPKPGSLFSFDATVAREPDVVVRQDENGLAIDYPNKLDIDIVRWPKQKHDLTDEMREAYAQAGALKRAIDMRRSALEEIAELIVARQSAYFTQGVAALVPMTLSEIAEETGFNVSTVSRILNGLLIEGPGGIVPARSLFAKAASTQVGIAKPKVVARIRQMITYEDPALPLSDQRLSEILAQEGLRVSRRVVAKYRQETNIPAALQRRRLSIF